MKYIFIDTETGKPYTKMPTDYHENIVTELRASIDSQSIMTSPVLVQTNGVIELKTDALKHPDIFIFGPDRTETNRNRTKCKIRRLNDERKQSRPRRHQRWIPHQIHSEAQQYVPDEQLSRPSACRNRCLSNGAWRRGAHNVQQLASWQELSR